MVSNLMALIMLIAQAQGQILWAAPGPGGIYCAIPGYDYNGDGHPDVIAAAYYGAYPAPPIRLYLRSGINGEVIWTRSDCQGVWGTRSLRLINDISGDSIPDIIMGTPGGVFPGRTIFAINGLTSQTIWSYCYYPTGGWVYSVAPTVDIDNDGYPEVLVATGGVSPEYRGFVQCFSGHTGTSLWVFRPNDAAMCVTPHWDITGDGVLEVLVAAGGNSLDNRIYCLDGANGTVVWSFLTGNSVEYVLSIGDINGNGIPDVVGGGWAYTLYCLEGSNGTLIWQNNLGSGRVIYELRRIRDINGDGFDDIVVGSWSSQVSIVSGATGTVLWSTEVGADCWNIDTLPDLSGDLKQEVVVGSLNGRRVAVLDGANGSIIWQYQFLDRVYDVACAGDLNGDQIADVLVGLQDQQGQANHLYAFSGLPLSIEENEKSQKAPELLIYNTKNCLTLALNLKASDKVTIRLYNLAGQMIENLVSAPGPDGKIRCTINKAQKKAGIYFLHLATQNKIYTLKLPLY